MGDFFRGFCDSCRHFFGCYNRNINGDLIVLLVSAILLVSLLIQPLMLTALALLGLLIWAIFF